MPYAFFRNLFFVISALIFVASPVFAQETSTPCGMEATADGERVKSGSFEICPEDLAFQGTYLLWSDIFKDPFFRLVSLFFVDEATLSNSFTQFADQQMGLSQITFALLSATAILCWMLLGPLLAFKGYQYFAFIQKTGSYQFGEGKGDTVKFVLYFLFLVSLILPVGKVMMGQGLAIVMSLPSIMGGNFIFSTYLNSFRDAAANINMNNDTLLMSSQGATNALIESELCQDRTRKAIFSLNGAQFSDFYNREWLYVDHDDVREVYSSCLSYIGIGTVGAVDGSLSSIDFDKHGSRQTRCPKLDAWPGTPANYDKDQHGYSHTCGRINFNMSVDTYASLLEEDHSELGDEMSSVLKDTMSDFSARRHYPTHKQRIGYNVREIVSDESKNEQQKNAEIERIITDSADRLKATMSSHPTLSRGNIDELQFAHIAAGAALFGGTMDRGFLYQAFQRNIRNGSLSLTGNLYDMLQGDMVANYYFPAHDLPDRVFGVDYLLEDAREIARLMQEYHCAMNWDKYTSTRLAITKFNTANNIRGEFAKGMPSMECIRVLPENLKGNTDKDRYWVYNVRDPRANDDIVNQAGSTWIKISGDTTDTQQYMSTEVAQRIYREMRSKQLVLGIYIASVQKALADNLSEKLNQTLNERSSYHDLRSRGWATFGGTLLYLNKTQNSSSHMANAIQEILQVESAGDGDTYIDTNAFPQAKLSELTGRINELYSPLNPDGIFSLGQAGLMDHPGPQGVSSKKEEDLSMNSFLRMLESWTMGPLKHVKEAGGLPTNKRLTEGLKECFDNGYSECVSGHKHPMTAMMRFGDETMNNMLNLMAVRAVVKTINRIVSGAGSGLEKGSGSVSAGDGPDYEKHKKASKSFFKDTLAKSMSFVKGVVSRLLTLITVISIPAESILDMMMPFAVMLLVVGALFAYIIPLTAYLYGFMLFALWMVGIAVVAFVLPFYALSKLFNIEKSYQRGFQDFYEGFVGPYLRPLFYGIAAVLAFSFMYIIVFVTNTVFGLVYDGLSTTGTGFSITGLLFDVMMYVMYLASILIMFRYALGIMKSFPDMMMSKLRLQRSNDEKFIDSLGFETYLNAKIIQEVADNVNRSVGQMTGGTPAERENLKRFKDFNQMIDDAGGPERIAEALALLQQQNAQNNNERDPGTPGYQEQSAPLQTSGGDNAKPANNGEKSNGGESSANRQTSGSEAPNQKATSEQNSAAENELSWAGPQRIPDDKASENDPEKARVNFNNESSNNGDTAGKEEGTPSDKKQ